MRHFLTKRLLAGLALCLAALAGVLSPTAPALAVTQADALSPALSEDGKLTANMDDVQLEDFIRFIGRYTGRNMVYRPDQIPKITFNIYSQEPIDEPQLMAIFNEVLTTVGMRAVAKGDLMYIMPVNQAKNIQGDVKKGARAVTGDGEEVITTVYRMPASVPVQLAGALLKSMVSPGGQLLEIEQAQAVLIQDSRSQIKRMMEVLETIVEASPEWEKAFIPLEKAQVDNVVKMITGMYAELVKRGRSGDAPMLFPVPWSNSILFMGAAEQKEEVLALVQELDRVDEAASGIKIYRLQNAKASSVAGVLQSLVQVVEGEQTKTVSDMMKVSSDADTNSVIVVTTKDIFSQVDDIIAQLDVPQDQVFIEALIMETTLTNSKRFGVEWLLGGAEDTQLGSAGFVDSGGSSLLSYASPVLSDELTPPNLSALPGGFSLGYLGNIITYGDNRFPTIGALVDFLKSVNEINILSTPQVMTLDNAEAEVFVGENRPFLVSEKFDANNNPVQTFDYRDVGTKLKVTPSINGESGLIRLDVEQEVKQVSETGLAPVTLNRFTKTTVQVLDGSTIVISGLVEDDLSKGRTGIPGLAGIPVVGNLFKRDSTSATKTTLMVFLTAKIVRTLDAAEALTRRKIKQYKDFKETSGELFEREFSFEGLTNDPTGIFDVDDFGKEFEADKALPVDAGPLEPAGAGGNSAVEQPATGDVQAND